MFTVFVFFFAFSKLKNTHADKIHNVYALSIDRSRLYFRIPRAKSVAAESKHIVVRSLIEPEYIVILHIHTRIYYNSMCLTIHVHVNDVKIKEIFKLTRQVVVVVNHAWARS